MDGRHEERPAASSTQYGHEVIGDFEGTLGDADDRRGIGERLGQMCAESFPQGRFQVNVAIDDDDFEPDSDRFKCVKQAGQLAQVELARHILRPDFNLCEVHGARLAVAPITELDACHDRRVVSVEDVEDGVHGARGQDSRQASSSRFLRIRLNLRRSAS